MRYTYPFVTVALAILWLLIPSFSSAQEPDVNVETTQPPQEGNQGDKDVVVVEDSDSHAARTERSTTTRMNTESISSGLTVFAISYVVAVIAGASSSHPADDRLFIPLAGPWLAIDERRNCPPDQDRCDDKTVSKVLLGIDGVFQAAGIITAVVGLLVPVSYTTTTTRHGTELKLTPQLGLQHTGLQLSGRF